MDIGERRNFHQPLEALRPMADTVLATVCERLRREGRLVADSPGRADRRAPAVRLAARRRLMALRCVYTDIDGTLVGAGASLFRDGDGDFTLLPARALEACHRAGVEVVLKSGRRKAQVMEDARLIGQSAYIYEVGSGLVIDGEETLLCGEFAPRDGRTPHELIAATGAPALLECEFDMEPHAPWHVDRFVSHLYRGRRGRGGRQRAARARGSRRAAADRQRRGRRGRAHLPPDPRDGVEGGRGASCTCARGGSRRRSASLWATQSRTSASLPSWARSSWWPTGPCRASGPTSMRTESGFGDGFYEAVVQSLVQ